MATTLSYGIATATSTVVFMRLTGLRFVELWRIQRSDISAYFELARHVLEWTWGRVRRTSRPAEVESAESG
jgi:hypothetical protein